MKKIDFENIMFLADCVCLDTSAHLTVNGGVNAEVYVTQCASCDVMSFDNEDYDGDSGLYESGFEVVIYTPESEALGEFWHINYFKTLWEAVEYINIKTLPPEGYVYIAPERT